MQVHPSLMVSWPELTTELLILSREEEVQDNNQSRSDTLFVEALPSGELHAVASCSPLKP